MPSYPVSIRRCQHIKVNGTQCGSPALRDEKYCYYHLQCHEKNRDINMNFHERGTITLPTLEDANSIQVGLAEVMRLLVTNQIDHRTAALLLHALRTASINLKHTSFEPEQPTRVVIDRECVERRPIGATAWSMVEGREYDEVENADVEKDELEKDEVDQEEAERGRAFMAELKRLSEGVARDPGFLDRRAGDLGGEQ
ncbi:MAG: hypothetical protein ABR861_14315 [Terriglobales bacterium]|jgi:hypothetical protein